MKSFFLLCTTLLIGLTTFACPQLDGIYNCDGNSKEFSGTVQIAQNGITYYLPYVPSDLERGVYTFVANNTVEREVQKSRMGIIMVSRIASCHGNVLETIQESQSYNEATKQVIPDTNYSMTSTYTLTQANEIEVRESLAMNTSVISATSAICKRSTSK